MKTKLREISALQLALLLVVGRLFLLMTFSPNGGESHGAASLVAILLGAGLALIAGIPALLLTKRTGCGVLLAAERAGEGFSFAACAAFGLFCLVCAAMTAVRFGFFMTAAVYPNNQPWLFILGLILAGAYAAHLGLEPVARLSLPVFLITLLAGIIMMAGLWRFIRLERMITPLYDGWQPIGGAALRAAASYAEAALFLLFVPRVKKQTGSATGVWIGWLAVSAAAIEGFAFLILTALGEYAGTRLFPLHTAAAAARLGPLGRLDFIFLFLWVFAAFLRLAIYLYGSCVCFKGLNKKMALGARASWTGAAAAVLAVSATAFEPLKKWLSGAIESGIWLAILLVGFPVLLLLTPRAKIPAKEEETA